MYVDLVRDIRFETIISKQSRDGVIYHRHRVRKIRFILISEDGIILKEYMKQIYVNSKSAWEITLHHHGFNSILIKHELISNVNETTFDIKPLKYILHNT